MCFSNTLKRLLKFQRTLHFSHVPIYFLLDVVAVSITLQSIKILAQLTSQNVLFKTFYYLSLCEQKHSNLNSSFPRSSGGHSFCCWEICYAKNQSENNEKCKTVLHVVLYEMSYWNSEWIWRHPHNLPITESVGQILFWKPLLCNTKTKEV